MLNITARFQQAQLCCFRHLAHMMSNANALSHFLMPIKSMVNGWQVDHWSLVRTCLRQILSCLVPAPQSRKLQLKTICYGKECAPLPWEPLNKPGMTEWLCAVLQLFRNADIVCFRKKHLWHLWLLTFCDNLTAFSSTKIQNKESSIIKRKMHLFYIFHKDFPNLRRLNCHPLCLNRALSSSPLQAYVSEFQLSSTRQAPWIQTERAEVLKTTGNTSIRLNAFS